MRIAHVLYLLKPSELWARAYAQFIATRAGDPLLLAELRAEQADPMNAVYPRQWDDADFAPIAAAMEVLFRQKGWML